VERPTLAKFVVEDEGVLKVTSGEEIVLSV